MMKNRVAIITGAAQGLGKAVAERCVKEKYRVHLLDNDIATLEATNHQLSFDQDSVTCGGIDVADQAACESAVETCVQHHGQVDVLINCAGVYPRVGIMDITKQDWHMDFDINVMGTYFMMVAATRAMKNQGGGGRIVNISSIDAYQPHPGNAHYAASKAAVVSLTRSFALAVADEGILINSVAPGPLATEKAKKTDWYESAVAELPTGCPIEPSEIAETVVYLSRPENKSLTGENIIVSGGGVMA